MNPDPELFSMLRAAIFDFDGTLTPLTLDFGHLRAHIEAFAERYVDRSLINTLKGEYILEMIYSIADAIGDKGPPFQKDAFHELDILEIESSRGKELYPYARDTLAYLRQNGVHAGIITRSCMEVINEIFPDCRNYADVIVTRDDTRYVKPDPEQLRIAVHGLNVNPNRAIIVGDHPTDIAAGLALGTQTAGVLSGRSSRQDFIEAGANHIFDDIRGIKELEFHPE